MIVAEPTPKFAGLTVWADVWDFEFVHALLYKIADSEELSQKTNEYLLSLAYDIRKSFEFKREKKTIEQRGAKKIMVGFKINWIHIISQLAIIRTAFSSMSTQERDRAILLNLEALIREALTDSAPGLLGPVMNVMQNMRGWDAEHVSAHADGYAKLLIELPLASQRKRNLVPILHALNPHGRDASFNVIPIPAPFAPWPDFEW